MASLIRRTDSTTIKKNKIIFPRKHASILSKTATIKNILNIILSNPMLPRLLLLLRPSYEAAKPVFPSSSSSRPNNRAKKGEEHPPHSHPPLSASAFPPLLSNERTNDVDGSGGMVVVVPICLWVLAVCVPLPPTPPSPRKNLHWHRLCSSGGTKAPLPFLPFSLFTSFPSLLPFSLCLPSLTLSRCCDRARGDMGFDEIVKKYPVLRPMTSHIRARKIDKMVEIIVESRFPPPPLAAFPIREGSPSGPFSRCDATLLFLGGADGWAGLKWAAAAPDGHTARGEGGRGGGQ